MKRSDRLMLIAIVGALSAGVASASGAVQSYTAGGGTVTDAPFGASATTHFPLTISSTNAVVDSVLSVTLSGFTHTFAGDMMISLSSPGGATTFITSPPDFADANFNGDYVFRVDPFLETVDEALFGQPSSYDLPAGPYAISGYGGGIDNGPRSTFDGFVGTGLAGTWTLTIEDYFPGDTGALGSWTLQVDQSIPEPASLTLLASVGLLSLRRGRR